MAGAGGVVVVAGDLRALGAGPPRGVVDGDHGIRARRARRQVLAGRDRIERGRGRGERPPDAARPVALARGGGIPRGRRLGEVHAGGQVGKRTCRGNHLGAAARVVRRRREEGVARIDRGAGGCSFACGVPSSSITTPGAGAPIAGRAEAPAARTERPAARERACEGVSLFLPDDNGKERRHAPSQGGPLTGLRGHPHQEGALSRLHERTAGATQVKSQKALSPDCLPRNPSRAAVTAITEP